MIPIHALHYQGTPIRLRGAMLNLTDMWQAAGRPEHRRPSDWLLLEQTQRFRAYAGTHWTEADDPVAANAGPAGIWHIDTDGFVATVRGHQGGTWAHSQGSPHSGLTLGEMNEPGGWCLVAGKNRAEPMLVLF